MFFCVTLIRRISSHRMFKTDSVDKSVLLLSGKCTVCVNSWDSLAIVHIGNWMELISNLVTFYIFPIVPCSSFAIIIIVKICHAFAIDLIKVDWPQIKDLYQRHLNYILHLHNMELLQFFVLNSSLTKKPHLKVSTIGWISAFVSGNKNSLLWEIVAKVSRFWIEKYHHSTATQSKAIKERFKKEKKLTTVSLGTYLYARNVRYFLFTFSANSIC